MAIFRTVQHLTEEVEASLDDTYGLVSVDYRDSLTDEQVAEIVRAEEFDDDNLDTFASDQMFDASRAVVDEAIDAVAERWQREDGRSYAHLVTKLKDDPDSYDELRFTVEGCEDGLWFSQLLRQTPRVLLRVAVDGLGEDDVDEVNNFLDQATLPETAGWILHRVGLEGTEGNIDSVAVALGDMCTTVPIGYYVLAVETLYELPTDPDAEVDIVNPHLFLGNPFTGAGFVTEKPLTGVVRVRRGDLLTDKEAFGYGVAEIYGGVSVSDFEAEVRAVQSEPVGCSD
jgi:hypothetical protein